MEQDTAELDMMDWVVVATAASTRFLGRVVRNNSLEDVRKMVETALDAGWSLRLFPVFEFLAPIEATDEATLTRKPLVLPIDFAVNGTPLYVRPVFAYLCCDMHESDRDAYKSFVQQALELKKSRTDLGRGGSNSGGVTH